MPKKCLKESASHPYSCSFLLCDQSHTNLGQPISFNYFFHNLSEFPKDIRVGDILLGYHVNVQSYRDFPQFSANYEKSKIYIIKFEQDYYNSGLIDVQMNPEQVAESSLTWHFQKMGRDAKELSSFSSNLLNGIYYMKCFAQNLLYNHTVADFAIPLRPIHDVYTALYDSNQKLNEYRAMVPKAKDNDLIRTEGPLVRVDLVALVMDVKEGNETNPTQLILWDGTAHGITSLQPMSGRTVEAESSDSESEVNSVEVKKKKMKLPEAQCKLIHHTIQAGLLYYKLKHVQPTAPFHPSATSTQQTASSQTLPSPDSDVLSIETVLDAFRSSLSTAVSNFDQRPTDYLGMPIVLEGADNSHNHYLARFTPGTWVRIRNMYLIDLAGKYDQLKGFYRYDTVISAMEIYFW
jgi:hypothetical protein